MSWLNSGMVPVAVVMGRKLCPFLDPSERQSSSCEQVCNKASFFFSRSSLWVSKSWIEASTLILDKGLQPCSLYQSAAGALNSVSGLLRCLPGK